MLHKAFKRPSFLELGFPNSKNLETPNSKNVFAMKTLSIIFDMKKRPS